MQGVQGGRVAADEALSAVRAACQDACTGEHMELFWIGKRDAREILADPAHELAAGAPAIRAIMQQYPEQAERIIDGDAWEHGYHAGALAFARLIAGLAVIEPWESVARSPPRTDEEQKKKKKKRSSLCGTSKVAKVRLRARVKSAKVRPQAASHKKVFALHKKVFAPRADQSC